MWVGWVADSQTRSKPLKRKTKSPRKSPFSTQISPFVFQNLIKTLGWVGKQIWEWSPKKTEIFLAASLRLTLGSSKCWLPVFVELIVLLNRFPGGAYDRRPADFKGFSSTRIISETTLPLIQPTLTRATRNYHFPFLIFSFDHLVIFSIIWDAFDIVMISWLLK